MTPYAPRNLRIPLRKLLSVGELVLLVWAAGSGVQLVRDHLRTRTHYTGCVTSDHTESKDTTWTIYQQLDCKEGSVRGDLDVKRQEALGWSQFR